MTVSLLAQQAEGNILVPGVISRSFTVPTGIKMTLVVISDKITAATYNGISLTNSSGFWILTNPPVGTYNLVMTFNATGFLSYYGALVYDNTKFFSPITTSYIVTSQSNSSSSVRYNAYQITGSGNFRVDGLASFVWSSGLASFRLPVWSGATLSVEGLGISNTDTNSISIANIGSGNSVYNGTNLYYGSVFFGVINIALSVFGILESASSSSISSENTSNIKYNGSTVSCNINGNGYSNTTYIEYGTVSGNYTTQLATETLGTGVNVYSKPVTGLTANTTYYWRVVSDNGNWSANGTEQSFITLPTPTTTTSSASLITANSATLNGFITNGNVEGTHYFQYGIATGVYTNTTTSTSNTANSLQQAISASITGLTTSVPIFYRTVLIVDGITYNGAEMSFIPGNAPVLSLTAETLLTNTTVTLNGLVNPGGLATNYQFQYGTTIALGTNTTLTSAGSGTSNVAVSSARTGLLQNTVYYYRLCATNGGGTNYTAISSFITNGIPVISSFTVEDAVTYTTNVFRFNQEINDTSGTYVINYGIAPATYTLNVAGSITADGTITKSVSGLLPNKTYYARLSITNSFGTVTSSEISFSTFASPFTTIWTNPDTEPTSIWVNQNI